MQNVMLLYTRLRVVLGLSSQPSAFGAGDEVHCPCLLVGLISRTVRVHSPKIWESPVNLLLGREISARHLPYRIMRSDRHFTEPEGSLGTADPC